MNGRNPCLPPPSSRHARHGFRPHTPLEIMQLRYSILSPLVLLASSLPLCAQTSVNVAPPHSAAAGSGFCAEFVIDQANKANCVQTSSVPTLGMLLPLGPELFVSTTGEVGIGTTSPITRLGVDGGVLPGIFASTDAIDASAITGWAPATTGSGAFGLYGQSDGDLGTGGLGWATDLTGGITYGLYGQADSAAGSGVFGWATDLTGATVGVSGEADSPLGTGVFGWASDVSGGLTAGVYGESDSPSGTGVFGWASDLTGGFSSGVQGISDSANGVGVFGLASDATGVTAGVSGQASSSVGTGVVGWATATTGTTTGVRGASDADLGAGVEGFATEATGANYGVYGSTASPAGFGVFSAGDMGATGTKSFVQPHPRDPSKEIRFVCLEGNESGTYFRGSSELINGRATIVVPESFGLVSEEEGLTVQLTAIGAPANLWIESQSLRTIVVRADRDVNFHYFVNGVRRGFASYTPIRENVSFVPQELGQAFGTQYPAGLQAVLIANGILNPDGTPNEQTASEQGWDLRDVSTVPGGQARPVPSTPAAKGLRNPLRR